MAAIVGSGAYAYLHLNGNLHTVALFTGTAGNAGQEKPDPFGRTPINLLVIGSDARSNSTDCRLGGNCGGGGNNADVEMVVHVSADRSNATVMSVPRDTMTQLPECRNPNGSTTPARYGQINSSLAEGPGCTVAAVHQLTGIPIDHFVMVDFSGVVNMSDAVGGVTVCVSNNVYDTYSHLKLSKGKHVLKGVAALEFVRSRHAFGDGSDLGRTYAQHAFLSAVIRSMKSSGTLANPVAVYSLANAATKALTVDTGLGSIPTLIGLARDVNKVPSNRITFTTMQNYPDPSNPARVLVSPSAQNLFQTIANDQSLTNAAGGKSGAAQAAAKSGSAASTAAASAGSAPRSQIAVRVENGTGRSGRAAAVANTLIAKGFSPATTAASALAPAARTILLYAAGRQADASSVAGVLGLPASAVRPASGQQGTVRGLTLVIGADWSSGLTYSGPGSSPAPVNRKAALSQAHAQTANKSGSCVPVSTQATVSVNGVPMSPIQAYAVSRGKADSAP
jgi:LCP family protein required for cell wall assembly